MSIIIGDTVWIGMNLTILKEVTIGDAAVVGAGSLVNKEVLPNEFARGIPATVIKERIQ